MEFKKTLNFAAKINGKNIDLSKIIQSIPNEKKLLVEGAGGVLVPLNEKFVMIDLIEALEIPVIIVARSGLGTINHTLLTLEVLRERDIKILGVILNGEKNDEKYPFDRSFTDFHCPSRKIICCFSSSFLKTYSNKGFINFIKSLFL